MIYLDQAPGPVSVGEQVGPFASQAMIPTSLDVASTDDGADPGEYLSFGYDRLGPVGRRRHLTWLSTGKRNTSFNPSYAHLYLHGPEHRLLMDDPSLDEQVSLIPEVNRLGRLYPNDAPFTAHCRNLADAAQLLHLSMEEGGIETWRPDLGVIGGNLPMLLQVKVGMMIAASVPLDADHAIAAMLAMTEMQGGIRLTRSMSWARDEYIVLLRNRFAVKYPDGILIQDNNLDSAISALYYTPLSTWIHAQIFIDSQVRLPHLQSLDWSAMAALCSKASDDLALFAKVIGKDRGRAGSVAAALVLPPEIANDEALASLRNWLDGLPSPVAEVPLSTLSKWCFAASREVSGAKCRWRSESAHKWRSAKKLAQDLPLNHLWHAGWLTGPCQCRSRPLAGRRPAFTGACQPATIGHRGRWLDRRPARPFRLRSRNVAIFARVCAAANTKAVREMSTMLARVGFGLEVEAGPYGQCSARSAYLFRLEQSTDSPDERDDFKHVFVLFSVLAGLYPCTRTARIRSRWLSYSPRSTGSSAGSMCW